MHVQKQIEGILQRELVPTLLEVVNESAMHSVPKGSETHFKVVVVSAAFAGRSAVDRHREVFRALAAPMREGVHALTITARTPEEWDANSAVAVSPPASAARKPTRAVDSRARPLGNSGV